MHDLQIKIDVIVYAVEVVGKAYIAFQGATAWGLGRSPHPERHL
jgi:hypothetical protein